MADRPAPALALRDGDREEPEGWLRWRSVRSGLAKPAQMIRLAADGVGNREIAQRVDASPTTVIEWRNRYAQRGLSGLEDRVRSGRPRELDHAAIVTASLQRPPKRLGITHWSTRLLAGG